MAEYLISGDPTIVKVTIVSIIMLSPTWGLFLFGYFLSQLERRRDEKRNSFWKGYTYEERKEAYKHLSELGL